MPQAIISDYNKLKVGQLRAKLQEKGICDPGLRRNGLIAALEHADQKATKQMKTRRASKVVMTSGTQTRPSATGLVGVPGPAHVRKDRQLKPSKPSGGQGQRLDDQFIITRLVNATSVKILFVLSVTMLGVSLLLWILLCKNNVRTDDATSAAVGIETVPWACPACDQRSPVFAQGQSVAEGWIKE